MIVNGQDLYTALIGSWDLKRSISNQGEYSGIAQFSAINDETILYREDGVLNHYNGSKIEGYREYLYLFSDKTLKILFHDGPSKGQIYNNFQLDNQSVLEDMHFCGDDEYHCIITWDLPSCFINKTTITGPKKDYALQSIFSK